jgi:hypothetical protein
MKANSDRAAHRKISEGGKYSLRDSGGQILATAKHWNDARKLWLAATVPCKVFNGESALTAFQP